MNVNGKPYKTLCLENESVCYINQTYLPFSFKIEKTSDYRVLCKAIREMEIRGAGAIGVAAGFAMALAFFEFRNSPSENLIASAKEEIENTRPTARDLFFATQEVYMAGRRGWKEGFDCSQQLARQNEDSALAIAIHGESLIPDNARIQTHCNAGWLGFVDWGSALAPVYLAHRKGKKVFVYVDETRPRLQGSRLTAWELQQEGIPFKILPDHAGAWLMKNERIDLVITGADRVAANGDVANKIGTLERAIVAQHFGIPFFVAAPITTFDKECPDGNYIPIEHRNSLEVTNINGTDDIGNMQSIKVCVEADVYNPSFDVTPAELIHGIITEKGMIPANPESIRIHLNLK